MAIGTRVFSAIALAAFAVTGLVPAAAGRELDYRLPRDWRHEARNGQHIFLAPGAGGREGLSTTPLGTPGFGPQQLLDNILGQYRRQHPDFRLVAACPTGEGLAMAVVEFTGPSGLLEERLIVMTGSSGATLINFWAPPEIFAQESERVGAGREPCGGNGAAAPSTPVVPGAQAGPPPAAPPPADATASYTPHIPDDWRPQYRGGRIILLAPQGHEGFSSIPLGRPPGGPADILNAILGQYRTQHPDFRLLMNCGANQAAAAAVVEFTAPSGPLRERLAVVTGADGAKLLNFWAPPEVFDRETARLGGQGQCAGGTAARQADMSTAPNLQTNPASPPPAGPASTMRMAVNIPPDWRREEWRGQLVFRSPSPNEWFAIIRLGRQPGSAENILMNFLDQARQHSADFKLLKTCSPSPATATALLEYTSPFGYVRSRITVVTGAEGAKGFNFSAPPAIFEKEAARLGSADPCAGGTELRQGGGAPSSSAPELAEVTPDVTLNRIALTNLGYQFALPAGWVTTRPIGFSIAAMPAGGTTPMAYFIVGVSVSDLDFNAILTGCTRAFARNPFMAPNIVTCMIRAGQAQIADSQYQWSPQQAILKILQIWRGAAPAQIIGQPEFRKVSPREVLYRFALTRNGRNFVQWGHAVMSYLVNPLLRRGPGAPPGVTSLLFATGCEAPREEAADPRLVAMCSAIGHSFRPGPDLVPRLLYALANFYGQEVQSLIRMGKVIVRGFEINSAMINDAMTAVRNLQWQTFNNFQASNLKIAEGWINAYAGTQDFIDPVSGKELNFKTGWHNYRYGCLSAGVDPRGYFSDQLDCAELGGKLGIALHAISPVE
jgi:hypothetical protein